MAKKKFNKYIGALLTGGFILMAPSCSDYDDHFQPDATGSESSTTSTLWDQIKEDPNLSMFANILEKAKYYKDDTHPVQGYTYADVLKSGQVSTVWAPENSSLESSYQTWLDMCETDGYAVEQQLIRNHIALWRHNVSGTGIDTIRTMNGKNIIFDRGNATFDGIQINKKNIPAMNGVLHTLPETTTFEYNFYEYIKYSGKTAGFGDFVIKFDTTYFSIDASIEGLPDENGNPTYVDSVYQTYNRLVNRGSWLPNVDAEKCMNTVKGFGWGSDIMSEDSMFIMIIPSENAWNEAYEKLKPYYTYASTYEDKAKGNSAGSSPAPKLTGYDPDSLTDLNIKMDLASPLVFNIHKQPKIGGYASGTPWTLERFLEDNGKAAEYLLNTYGDTIRDVIINQAGITFPGDANKLAEGQSVKWYKESLFENAKVIKMSNGYAFIVDKWDFPIEYYKPPVIEEISGAMLYNTSNTSNFKGRGLTKAFSNTAYSDITDIYGKVSKNNFYKMENGASNAKGEFRIHGNSRDQYMPTSSYVMSGKYDIYLVMVPCWYADIADAGEVDSLFFDSLYVDEYANQHKNKIKVQLRYNNGKQSDGTYPTQAYTFNYIPTKVDTVKIFSDFTFPYSYKNLRFSYPLITIESGATGADVNKNGFIREFCIDQLILRSKEE